MLAIAKAGREIGTIVCFRSLPTVGYAILTGRIRGMIRLSIAIVAALSLTVVHAYRMLELGDIALTYLYFGGMSCLLPWLSRQLRLGRITAGGVFVVTSLVYFVVPALVFPASAKAAVAMVIGWDMMLSGYSFCVDTSMSAKRPGLLESVFFMLVNPSLVYSRRGTCLGPPKANLAGVGRMVIAIGVLSITFVVLAPLFAMTRSYSAAPGRIQHAWLLVGFVAVTGAIRFLMQYARQSALASLQLGLLRQFGYVLPERYVWPLLASSPADFFRRWNLYVGEWLRRYVFWPLSLHIRPAPGGRVTRSLWTGLAIIITFLVCGALHQSAVYGLVFVPGTQMLYTFLLSGLLVAASIGVGAAWMSAKRRMPGLERVGPLPGILSRVSIWVPLVVVFYTWFN